MKIAQLVPRLNIGGVERGVLDLVSYFKDSQIKNIVISGPGNLVSQLKKLEITHYKLPIYKKSPVSIFLIPKLINIFKKENIDIVHARSRVPGWLGFFASRLSKTNFITTCHGVYKNKFFSEVMGWGKFVICPSGVVARHMHKNFGVPQEKIVIIPRWVDLEKFKFRPYQERQNNNIIVAIGRISPSKGYEYLIEAFRKVVRFNPYLKLKIIGSAEKLHNSYLNYLKTLVTRFALNYSVQFLGFRYDIENILNEARILVAPSVIEESFGRVIIEAFASGVPVIASRVGGFTEIIENEKDGILVEPKDISAISDAIIKLLNNLNFANNLSLNAYEKVKKYYSIDKCLALTRDVYLETVDFKRILIIKISSLGDVILSFPSLKEIRQNFPKSKIYYLTLNKNVGLLYGCPYIDGIITIEKDYKKIKKLLYISKILRRYSFDYVIDLQNNWASHILSFLSFPRASFGYKRKLGFLLTNSIKYYNSDPLTSQERILKFLGIKFKEKKLIFWDIKKDETNLLGREQLIGINVSASAKWVSKNWPKEHIVFLIKLIYKNFPNFKVVLFGDKDSQNIAKYIEQNFPQKIYDLCGKTTLNQLPALIKKTKVFISPDTATLHLAVALGVPTIGLFGPTNPSYHTVSAQNLYIVYKKLFCSFCYKPKCKLKEKNLCMEKILPQEVFSIIKKILSL
ncbi:MAG: glycosyltransferase [Candidatus Omnitrophica bacterium]|nr:glycosyltransferase [Candidatus Omnitrophota bacterium]